MNIQNFCFSNEVELEDLGNGIKRKVLSYHNNLMVVEIHFEENAVGVLHSHPHEQITYILEGEFEFNIDGVKKVVKAGDTTYKRPNIPHGVVCLKKGKLLDVFTPHREDFIKNRK